MDTEAEIRQRAKKAETSDTPALNSGGEGGEGGGLPVPSISKKHLAIIGVVVAVAVVIWWTRRSSDEGAGNATLESARSQVDGTTEATIEGEEEEEEQEIRVEHDPTNPLAADASVVKAFRQRGILSPSEED